MNFFFLILLIIVGCESRPLYRGEKKDLENVSMGAQSFQYFLPDIPLWANVNASGNCFRKFNIRYLDYNKINKSFALEYQQLVHFQHMINRRMQGLTMAKGERIDVKDENALFYSVYEQIQGGVYDFILPEYDIISVFWIDPIIDDEEKMKTLAKKIKDPNLAGYPIIMSFCMQDFELDQIITKYKLDEVSIKKIGAEMLSLFNVDMSQSSSFHLHLLAFLGQKKIIFNGPSELKLNELPDQMQFQKY